MFTRPEQKPQNNCFSCGPCAKYPGWSINSLVSDIYGRSHRSVEGQRLLKDIIDLSRKVLQLPQGYKLGITPASDSGAVEMALWNFIGSRPVDCFAWEAFSQDWLNDLTTQLQHANTNGYISEYGQIPDLSKYNPKHDMVFVYNGTTSGVKVPNLDWIPNNREGITICDATSAILAYDIDWSKIDILTYSWQKAIGGEAAHGIIVMSPRAIQRLQNFPSKRPLPKIFQISQNGVIDPTFWEGNVINTPSLLACVDALDALKWVDSIGGLENTTKRVQNNYNIIEEWVKNSPYFTFLVENKNIRSRTSITLIPKDKRITKDNIAKIIKLLSDEAVAFDINAYKTAPLGLRIWTGVTIESQDLELLTKWIDWASAEILK